MSGWKSWARDAGIAVVSVAGVVPILGFPRGWTLLLVLVGGLGLLVVMRVFFHRRQGAAGQAGPDRPLMWLSALALGVGLATLISAVPVVYSYLTGGVFCGSRHCYDFENGSRSGWGVREEGKDAKGEPVLLGERTKAMPEVHAGPWWQRSSLAFEFKLREWPRDKAQIKIDAARRQITLEQHLTAWVYVPADTARTLVVAGYVLERPPDGSPAGALWPFHQTGPVELRRGAWTRVSFAVSQFFDLNKRNGWGDQPELFGFEMRARHAGELDATVYFDKITVD